MKKFGRGKFKEQRGKINISSGVGAGAHFMRYTPEDTG